MPAAIGAVIGAAAALIAQFCYGIARRRRMPTALGTASRAIRAAIIHADAGSNFMDANESALRLFPSLQAIRRGAPVTGVDHWPAALRPIADLCDAPPIMFYMGSRYYSASVSGLNAAKKRAAPGYIILIQDVTDALVHPTKKLEEIAYADALTGISNLRHFMNLATMQVERMKRAGGCAYIVVFDLDRFKDVNDTHGRAVGDKVLRAIANIVRDTVRPYDLFARYGGEEFILFISDISEKDIKNYTERLRQSISNNPMTFEEANLTVTASFGVAPLVPKEGLESAIKLAEEALRTSKSEGRNRVTTRMSAVGERLP